MGIVIKQSFYNSINAYLGVGLGALNTLILFPQIFKDSPDFMGEVNTMLATATILATFGHLGTPTAVLSYLPRFNKAQARSLTTYASLIALGVSLVLLIGGGWYFFATQAPDYVMAGIAIAVGMMAFEVFASFAQIDGRVVVPELLKKVFRRLILLVALLYAYGVDRSPRSFYSILLVGYALHLLLILVYVRPSLPGWSWSLRPLPLKTLLFYGLFVSLATGAMVLVSKIDILMIKRLLSKADVAFYSIAFFIGSVVSVPAKSMMLSLRPIVSKAWARDAREEVAQVYKKSALAQLLMNGLLFLLVWVNIDLFYWFLPENYQQGQWVVFFIALGEVLAGGTGINGLIMTVSSKQRYNLYSGLLLIVLTVLTNFWLIPIYGIEGAALASVIALVLFNLVKLIMVRRFFGLLPFSLDYLKVALSLALLLAASLFLRSAIQAHLWVLVVSDLILIIAAFFAYRLIRPWLGPNTSKQD